MKNIKIISYLSLCFIIMISIILINRTNKKSEFPVPTEYIDKKKKRQDFKKHRKEWMENMHRAHPDDDWRLIDIKNRKNNTNKIISLREKLHKNKQLLNIEKEYISRDVQGQWNERGSNNLSGRILTADIDFDTNIIYCASAGGNIWKGTINGEDWNSLNDYMQITGIHLLRVINHEENKRLLISSGTHFYYTDDEGLTLNEPNGLDGIKIMRVIVKDDILNTIYLLSSEHNTARPSYSAIYKSVDQGENFDKIILLDSSNGFEPLQNDIEFDIWAVRYFESEVYLLHNNQFFSISDTDELQFISNIPTTSSGENVLTGGHNTNAPYFYARIDDEIYYSMNGGSTWAFKNTIPSWLFTKNSFNASMLNPDIIFWGGLNAFKSTNSGESWDLVNGWYEYYDNPENMLHADIPEIRAFLNNEYEEIYLISTDGGIYISYDALSSVENLSFQGLGVSQYYSTYTKKITPYSIYVGSQDQGFQRSINDVGGVLDFEQTISGDYGHLVSGDQGHTIWCNYPGFTMFYLNPESELYGVTLDFPGTGHLWLAPLMEDPVNPHSVYLGGGGTDGGNHLIKLNYSNHAINYEEMTFNFNSTISAMSYSPIHTSMRYLLTENGKFYYSSDDGINWEYSSSFTGPSPHYFYGSTILPSNTEFGTLFIGGSGYSNSSVYVSYNNGESFESFSNGLPNTLVYELCSTDDDILLFAATEIGPYVYSFIEDQWLLLSGTSAPDQTYWSCEYIPELQTVRFGTYGRGIWDFVINNNYEILFGDVNNDLVINIQDIITAIGFIIGNDIPDEIEFLASDINQDSVINVIDIVMIVDIIFGG